MTSSRGISLNTTSMKSAHILGYPFAKFVDYWFNKWSASLFEKVDYWGLSFYAQILFDPYPISEVPRPHQLDKMGDANDKTEAYKPEVLGRILRRFYKKYQKPIIITENGICTDNDAVRVQAIKDYLAVIHEAISNGVAVKGYIHWSTFDNFEWNLGPTYRFGLLKVDLETKNRLYTEGARFYEKVTKANAVEV